MCFQRHSGWKKDSKMVYYWADSVDNEIVETTYHAITTLVKNIDFYSSRQALSRHQKSLYNWLQQTKLIKVLRMYCRIMTIITKK